MGLIEPVDLAAWRRWQASRQRIRTLRHRRRPTVAEPAVLTTYDPDPVLLVAVDSGSPTSHAALIEPLRHLDVPVALLSPATRPDVPAGRPLASSPVDGASTPGALRGVRAVLSLGHYLPRGSLAHGWSRELGVPHFVSQHGALTPYAPPLPPDAHLLAWSEADAEFWRSGRRDVSHQVIGSQLLWQVGQQHRHPGSDEEQPLTYLGQLHAAELPRSRLSHAAADFCRRHSATYRPHPSERDRLSRWTHAGYRRLGIPVDASPALSSSGGPVVSVFSTGVLEAATQGRAAWVDFPRPPAWLGEFWERYGMHRFGGDPTPAPPLPESEPARRIAEILLEAVR